MPAKDANHRVLTTGATERYVFISRIENPPSLLEYIYGQMLQFKIIYNLYLFYTELLNKTENIYNEAIDKIGFPSTKKDKDDLFFPSIIYNIIYK